MTEPLARTRRHLPTEIPENRVSGFFYSDARIAWPWTIMRLYGGWAWLRAGGENLSNPAWTAWEGRGAGAALGGSVAGALKQVGGAHPNVQGWYGTFPRGLVRHHLAIFSRVAAYGETAVGVVRILGGFTRIAAFRGCRMNVDDLLVDAVRVHRFLFMLGLFLVLAWRLAGRCGGDRWILAEAGTPRQPGPVFEHRHVPQRAG